VIIYDGPCTLCNKSVAWIFKRDKNNLFLFGSLKSEWAKAHLPAELQSEDSVVFVKDNEFYIRSKAVLMILELLPRWKWTKIFQYLPSWLLDAVYKLIAKTRYKIFRQEFCAVLPQERIVK
jgi:predicted DCC family thiol-disulfide oxidoreductase YuxK|tara:strand:+ start:1059 stop:1421 length:363 start_codon:yes stop_codon:yes gene_type:complete